MPTITENTQYISTYHLQRLFLFRNSLIVAELILLAIAARIWAGDFPYVNIMLTIAAYTVFNLLTWAMRPKSRSISPLRLFLHLCVDVAALTLLLYFTGGANNPFVSLLLLPLLLVAAILPKRYSYGMAALTTLGYATLMLLPHAGQHAAPMAMQHDPSPFNAHAIGMAMSFLFSVAVILFFVITMAEALRDRERKLAEAHEKSLRDEHVIALGTLAAGAAHELGTPLGTMAILTKEIEREYADNTALLEQVQILREQVNRCKATISQMSSSAGQLQATGGKSVVISDYLASIANDWQHEHPQVTLRYHAKDDSPAPQLVVDDTLKQALLNLLNNAAEAGATHIYMQVAWPSQQLHIDISDDGAGLAPHVQANLGKPFVSTKAEGQGLGFYLAQAVITRMGGTIHIENKHTGKGAHVAITLPLQTMSIEYE